MKQTFGSVEIIQIADAVAREKNINKEIVIDAMEQAIQVAGHKKYGLENNIKADINRKNGEISLFRIITVVENPVILSDEATEEEIAENIIDEHKEIILSEAKKNDAELEIGDEIREALPPIDFGRIAAQTAKQVILQKVRDAERELQFFEYKDRVGEIINGTVKRIEYGHILVELGNNAEGLLRKYDQIPRESFRQGDRIRAYIADVRQEQTGAQIFLSRTHSEFMVKLFAVEVPEIYDGIVEIKAIARDPGSRAKIAVISHDLSVNAVLSCVGVRGSRVQSVVNELQGEKVDIIEYSPDVAAFVVNAISSAEVAKVVIDEDDHKIEIVVPDDQLSLAIGRRGQNVRLASQLVGWNIDILTEEAESERRAEEFNKLSNLFINALNVEEVIAQLLVTEGFTSIEEVAFVPLDEMASIEGFDEEVAGELRQRAMERLDSDNIEITKKLENLDIAEDLVNFEPINDNILVKLAENNIKNLDDLADLSTDEFLDIIPDTNLRKSEINNIIMQARAHWFEDEAEIVDRAEGRIDGKKQA